ncbi:MAG TPA: 2-phosphosulfolactate phosphatase [Gemmatimonadales bacterium]
MKISVFFTPLGLTPSDVGGRPVLVLDILRATTTIVEALANGARDIVPVNETDEAIKLAQALERDDVLLVGERKGERISGFALGNSPSEMVRDVVGDRTLVMSTTNGTRALTAAEAGNPVLVGAATNFSAVAEKLREVVRDADELVILCAGRARMFALEDAYAAGRFARAVIPTGQRRQVELNDAAVASLEITRRYGDRWKRAVSASAAARELVRLGFKDDVVAATDSDRHDLVPIYADKHVTLLPRS